MQSKKLRHFCGSFF